MRPRKFASLSFVFVLISCFVVLFGVGGVWKFGSFDAAIEWVRGENLLIDRRHKDLGLVKSGTSPTVTYSIFNSTHKPLRILGIKPSCSCTIVNHSQITIPAGELKTITASIDSTARDGSSIGGSLTLYTDDPSNQSVVLSFSGRISGR